MASHCGFQGILSLAPLFLGLRLSSGPCYWTMRGFSHLSLHPVTASLSRTSPLGFGRLTSFSFATTPTGDRYARPTRGHFGFWREGTNILWWTWAANRSDSTSIASNQLIWTWLGPSNWPSPRDAGDLQLCPHPLLPSLPKLPHFMPHTRVMAGHLPQLCLLDRLYGTAVVAG